MSERRSKNDPIRIAYLKSLGKSQKDIAQKLELSTATVSRALKNPEEAKQYLVVTPPTFRWDQVAPDMRAELAALDDDFTAAAELTDALRLGPNARGPRVTVVSAPTATASSSRGLEAFSARVAADVKHLLARANLVGVTWGRVVAALCDSLAANVAADGATANKLRVIPLCGESLGAVAASSLSSSHLAERLQKILNGASPEPMLSLGMIPVFFPAPEAFSDSELKAGRKLIGYSVSYATIFGRSGEQRNVDARMQDAPLADRLDAVVTSISSEGKPFGFGKENAFIWKTLKLADLQHLLIGDLGGVPLPRSGLKARDARRLESLLDRWTGLKERHLCDCAQRAFRAREGAAGVIVIGYGADRAACVIEAIKRGLVNHLFIDGGLRDGLRRELGV